jgi:hypothetical protein
VQFWSDPKNIPTEYAPSSLSPTWGDPSCPFADRGSESDRASWSAAEFRCTESRRLIAVTPPTLFRARNAEPATFAKHPSSFEKPRLPSLRVILEWERHDDGRLAGKKG